MTTEIETQEAQSFEEAFTLNDELLTHATQMEQCGLDNNSNRGTLAILHLHLKRRIIDVVRKYMRPYDKVELERLFESVAEMVAKTRLEIQSRRYVDRVRAKQLLHDLDALQGLANDYKTEIFQVGKG